MDMTIISMLIYILATLMIIIVIGHLFFKWGKYYLAFLLPTDLAEGINKSLLVAYYLFNIGYAFLLIKGWGIQESWQMVFEELTNRLGSIIFLLGLMHYNNIICIELYVYFQKKKIKN